MLDTRGQARGRRRCDVVYSRIARRNAQLAAATTNDGDDRRRPATGRHALESCLRCFPRAVYVCACACLFLFLSGCRPVGAWLSRVWRERCCSTTANRQLPTAGTTMTQLPPTTFRASFSHLDHVLTACAVAVYPGRDAVEGKIREDKET